MKLPADVWMLAGKSTGELTVREGRDGAVGPILEFFFRRADARDAAAMEPAFRPVKVQIVLAGKEAVSEQISRP